MKMHDWNEQTQIHQVDPMIGYLIRAAKAYGVKSFDEVWGLANDYKMRDRFAAMVHEVQRQTFGEMAFDAAPYGGSPGGLPYAEFYFVRPILKDPTECDTRRYVSGEHQEWSLTFGIDEGTKEDGFKYRWYVDLKDDGDVRDFVFISMEDATAEVIVGWLRLFLLRAQEYCNYETKVIPQGERPVEVWTECDHHCDATDPAMLVPEARHFLDCPVWQMNHPRF